MRAVSTFTDSQSFLRVVIRHGYLDRYRDPHGWFLFRQSIFRAAARRKQFGGMLHTVGLGELCGRAEVAAVATIAPAETAYSVALDELLTISTLVACRQPHTLFEFGTFDGRTTLHLALNSPEDSVVYTLDKQAGEFEFAGDSHVMKRVRVGEWIRESQVRNKVRLLTGDSRDADLSFLAGKVDFVFVDGDHSFEGVVRESALAVTMLAPGGMIVWHDYLKIADVTEALTTIGQSRQLRRIGDTTLVAFEGDSRDAG